MEIYQELLSLKFTEIHKFDTWHEDVRLFVVHDTNEVCISTITKTSTILPPSIIIITLLSCLHPSNVC